MVILGTSFRQKRRGFAAARRASPSPSAFDHAVVDFARGGRVVVKPGPSWVCNDIVEDTVRWSRQHFGVVHTLRRRAHKVPCTRITKPTTCKYFSVSQPIARDTIQMEHVRQVSIVLLPPELISPSLTAIKVRRIYAPGRCRDAVAARLSTPARPQEEVGSTHFFVTCKPKKLVNATETAKMMAGPQIRGPENSSWMAFGASKNPPRPASVRPIRK